MEPFLALILASMVLGGGIVMVQAGRAGRLLPSEPWRTPLTGLEERLRAAGLDVRPTRQSSTGNGLKLAIALAPSKLALPPPSSTSGALADILDGAGGPLGESLARIAAHGGSFVDGSVLAVRLDRLAVCGWQPADAERAADDIRALVAAVEHLQSGGKLPGAAASSSTDAPPDAEGPPSGAPFAVPTLRER